MMEKNNKKPFIEQNTKWHRCSGLIVMLALGLFQKTERFSFKCFCVLDLNFTVLRL